MSATDSPRAPEGENSCVVCFKNVDVFSVGVCDHPVCFECSTRMRVLCNQLECPICRQEMPKVVFTKIVEPFIVLLPKTEPLNILDRKYGLFFATTSIQRRYQRLLEHECIICKRNACNYLFNTFKELKDHMRRNHELFYCELCVLNLKIFTFERTYYTRTELALHRRKGDPNNTSHRGHPICEFCNIRYMDNDDLFRHLRRDHLFCHFCDADGKHQYYNAYDDLRKHYLEEHYLCEEGECEHERFTSVFRTDIDLKAHYAAVHGKNLSKAANRQARTLEVEFTLAPRARPEGGRGRYNRHPDRQEQEGAVGYDIEPGGPGGGPQNDRLFHNPLSAENFPSLSGSTVAPKTVSNVTIMSKYNPLSEENFPSLGNAPLPPRTTAMKITGKFNPRSAADFPSLEASSSRAPAVTITRTVRSQQPVRNSVTFPMNDLPASVRVGSAATSGSVRLSVSGNIQDSSIKPNVSIHVNHKPSGAITTRISQSSVSVRPKSTEAFPALSSSEPLPQPQWVSQKKKEPKPDKVAPAPNLPPRINDFPSLSKGRKSSSVTVPVSNTWVNLNNFNSETKNSALSSASTSSAEPRSEPKVEKKEKKGKNKVQSSKSIELKMDTKADENKKKKKKKNGDEVVKGLDRLALNSEEENNEKNEKAHGEPSNVNGITKKRSELKIGALKAVEDVSKPPPGFSVKPPPGFNNFISLNSSSNDLTFTTSSGQSYSIVPNGQFFPPPNFKSRNQFLIEKFKAVFKDAEAIKQFKIYSDMFRVGEITAEKYYEHCEGFMGREFDSIFPELLALLPDVERQQDLYKVHHNRGSTKGLEMCATCKQVVLTCDLRNHLSNHVLENHFPVLNQVPENNNVWNRK